MIKTARPGIVTAALTGLEQPIILASTPANSCGQSSGSLFGAWIAALVFLVAQLFRWARSRGGEWFYMIAAVLVIPIVLIPLVGAALVGSSTPPWTAVASTHPCTLE